MKLLIIELKKYLFSWKKIFTVFFSYIIICFLIIFIISKIDNDFNNSEKIKIDIVFEKKDNKLFEIIKQISNVSYFKDTFIFNFNNLKVSRDLLNNNKIDSYIYISSKSIKDINYEFLKSASLISKHTNTYEYSLAKEFFNFVVSYFDAYHPSIISLFNILDKIQNISFNKEDILQDIDNNFSRIYNFKDNFFKFINISPKNSNPLLNYLVSLLVSSLILFTNTLINILHKSNTKNFCKLYKLSKISPVKLVFIRFFSIFIIITILNIPFILYCLNFSIIILSFSVSALAIMAESIFKKKSKIFIFALSLFMFLFSDGIISRTYFYKLFPNLRFLSLNYLFINYKSYYNNIIIILLSFVFLLIGIIFTKKRIENN